MITTYRCELCGMESPDRDEIVACEARGRAPATARPPRGLIVSGKWSHTWGYGDELFAAAVSVVEDRGHGIVVGVVWCRGNGAGDDCVDFRGGRGDILRCGPGRYNGTDEPDWRDWPEAVTCPAFWRCVAAAWRAGVVPLVLRGRRAVTLGEAGLAEEVAKFQQLSARKAEG